MDDIKGQLIVNKKHFQEALQRLLGSGKLRAREKLFLSSDGPRLYIGNSNRATYLAAKGHWTGIVGVAAKGFINLRRTLPDSDKLTLTCLSERLQIEKLSFSATWKGFDLLGLPLPDHPKCLDFVRLSQTESAGHLKQAGVLSHVSLAKSIFEERRDQILRELEEFGFPPDAARTALGAITDSVTTSGKAGGDVDKDAKATATTAPSSPSGHHSYSSPIPPADVSERLLDNWVDMEAGRQKQQWRRGKILCNECGQYLSNRRFLIETVLPGMFLYTDLCSLCFSRHSGFPEVTHIYIQTAPERWQQVWDSMTKTTS